VIENRQAMANKGDMKNFHDGHVPAARTCSLPNVVTLPLLGIPTQASFVGLVCVVATLFSSDAFATPASINSATVTESGQIAIQVDSVDSTLVSGFASGQYPTLSLVSEGYAGTSLGTVNRTVELLFDSAVAPTGSTYFTDTMTESSDAALVGHTPDTSLGGSGWSTNGAGTWTVNGANDNLKLTSAPSDDAIAWFNAGQADGRYSFNVFMSDASNRSVFGIFRLSDANNFWWVDIDCRGSSHSLVKVESGGGTLVASSTGVFETQKNATHGVTVTLNGSTIQVSIDGVLIFNVTDSAHNANTRHGVMLNASYWDEPSFDDFSFRELLSGATIICDPIEPIYDDDTAITLDAPAGLISDGTFESDTASGMPVANNSTVDYPMIHAALAGVIDSGGDLNVNYSVVNGIIAAEAVALQAPLALNGQPAAAVEFTLSDGSGTGNDPLTFVATAMSRSTYHPQLFYSACVAEGFLDADPFSFNSGGSGVFQAAFDTGQLNDGPLTLSVKAYPTIGDADSVRDSSNTVVPRILEWDLYNDDGQSVTQVTKYIDSRASMNVTGVSGTFEEGEKLVGQTSGAIAAFRSLSSGTLLFSATDSIEFVPGETIQGETSGATCSSGTPTYNGSDTSPGTKVSPFRTLLQGLSDFSVQSDDTAASYKLMGDSAAPTYYAVARTTSGGPVHWGLFRANDGLKHEDIAIVGPSYTNNHTDLRDSRIRFQNVTLLDGFRGDDSRGTALWLDDCTHTSRDGRVGGSSGWPFDEWGGSGGGGLYFTNSELFYLDSPGLDQADLARDLYIHHVNEDIIRTNDLVMEVIGLDNDSPDPAAHEDAFQPGATDGLLFYNVVCGNIATNQHFLTDDSNGIAICNWLAVNKVGTDGAFSQYGNSSSAHIIRNMYWSHVTFVNTPLSHRYYPGSTDENAFIRYCVLEGFTGFDLTFARFQNHLLDSTISEKRVTVEIAGNPWEEGVGPDEPDPADGTKRDYRPSTSSDLVDRIPTGERYVPFDIFGFDIPNDGTGAIGARQPRTVVVPDTTPPSIGSVGVLSQFVDSGPVNITYSGVIDDDSGLDQVELWVRKGPGAWQATGITSTNSADSLSFNAFSGDDSYYFDIRAKDVAGNFTDIPSGNGRANTTLDSTAPNVGTIDVDQYTSTSPFTLVFSGVSDSGSGLSSVTLWTRDPSGSWTDTGLTAAASSGNFSYPAFSGDGEYFFALRTTDLANNSSPVPSGDEQASTVFDTVAPTAGVLSGPAGTNSGSAGITYSGASDPASGIGQVELWALPPGGNWAGTGLTSTGASGSFSFNNFSSQGPYSFDVIATDNAGNSSPTPTGNGQISIEYDNVSPASPSVSSPQYASTLPISVSYNGDSDITTAYLWVRAGSGAWTDTGLSSAGPSGSFDFHGPTTDETYEFEVQVEDALGNMSPAPSGSGGVSTIYDTTAPTGGTLQVAANVSTTPISVQYSGVTDGTGSGVASVVLWVRKDGGTWSSTGLTDSGESGAFSYGAVSGDGTYDFAIQSSDNAGNQQSAPSGGGLASTVLDTTLTPGILTAPVYANSSPIELSYTGADAGDGQTVTVHLWSKKSDGGTWSDTGLSSTGASGNFAFSNVSGDDTYYFALQAERDGGIKSEEPFGIGHGSTLYDTTFPTNGLIASPDYLQSVPVNVTFGGLSDGDGSGLATAHLWMRAGSGGTWSDTGLSYDLSSGEVSGSFAYTDALSDGEYWFGVRAADKAGNLSPIPSDSAASRTIIDGTPPEITLLGEAAMSVEVNQSFIDPGATAVDAQDGDLTGSVQVAGAVNTSIVGTYDLTYSVADTAGNVAAPVVRTVNVVEPDNTFALDVVQPTAGGISASPGPNAPNNRYTADTLVTLTYTGANTDDIDSWNGATPQAGDPTVATVQMNSDKSVGVVLKRATGTVEVDTTPDTAAWTVTDGDGVQHAGVGDDSIEVPTGDISITYNPLANYTAPAGETVFLQKDSSVSFQGVYEDGTTYSVSAPRNLQGLPGETVECSISVDNAADLSGFALTLTFDASLVQVDAVSPGALISGWGQPQSNTTSNSVTVSGNGPTLADAGGVLAVVTFRVNDSVEQSGFTELTFGALSLTGAEGALPNVTSTNGKLSVELGEYHWGDADGDENVTVSDATILLNHSVGNTPVLPISSEKNDPNYTGGANVSGEEPAIIGAYDAGLVLQHNQGLLERFPADLNGDGLGPDFGEDRKEGGFTDKILKQIDESVARTVRIAGSITLQPGGIIEMPIGIDAATRVLGYRVELAYDPAVLSFDSAEKGSLTGDWLAPVLRSEPGRLTIAAAGAQDKVGTGSLAVVRFRVSNAAVAGDVTQMTIADALLNDGHIQVETQDNVYAPELASITPARGSQFGGTVVVLRGVNMSDVDTVLFGETPASTIIYQPDVNLLTAVAPPGIGTVDVTVSALDQASTMVGAFTFFEPDISVFPDPQTNAVEGQLIDIPIVLSGLNESRSGRLSFTLNYDRRIFTVLETGSIDSIIMPGPQAPGALLDGNKIKPGEWRFSIEGTLGPGVVGTVRLLTTRSGSQPTEALVYISEVSFEE